jgi:hypothetical protein
MVLHSEQEAYSGVLMSHIRGMAYRLRQLPEDKWDWTFHQAAPTPRTLALHNLQWLQCDRQHINQPDASTHKLLDEPPTEAAAICDALDREADAWEEMLKNLTDEDLAEERRQFNRAPMNVRGFVAHMVQNAIYKSGQFATIYFALGLDGEEPYEAPFPNPIYKELLGIS